MRDLDFKELHDFAITPAQVAHKIKIFLKGSWRPLSEKTQIILKGLNISYDKEPKVCVGQGLLCF